MLFLLQFLKVRDQIIIYFLNYMDMMMILIKNIGEIIILKKNLSTTYLVVNLTKNRWMIILSIIKSQLIVEKVGHL